MPKKADKSWYATFLMEYVGCGRLYLAAERAGISEKTVKRRTDDDPDFKEALERAEQLHNDPLYAVGYDQAMAGKFAYWQMFARAKFPDLFADKQKIEHSGTMGIEVVAWPASPEQDDEIDEALREAGVDPEHP